MAKPNKTKVLKFSNKSIIQVNSTLLEFCWNLGNEIVEKQKIALGEVGFYSNLVLI